MTRYHPAIVALHWIMAIMILMSLFAGKTQLDPMPNDDPMKIGALGGHMVFGLVIGLLLILRLIARLASEHPPAADAGHPLLNLGSKLSHWGFYALILAMVGSGMAMGQQFGLMEIALQGSGDPLPENFESGARTVHGIVSTLLLLLILVHVLAALYHVILLRDRLLRRMWFGNRRA